MSTPVNGGLTLALAVSECPKGLGCVNALRFWQIRHNRN
jgi:hypothetical protein